MLIKRVYEIDPLACPRCGGQMKVVAFIELPQRDVIEKILRHCGLWHPSTPRAPPAGDGSVHDPDGASDRQTGSSDEPRELTYVDIDTFLEKVGRGGSNRGAFWRRFEHPRNEGWRLNRA